MTVSRCFLEENGFLLLELFVARLLRFIVPN